MSMQPLLVELGTEELPVVALPGLAQALLDGVVDGLVRRGIAVERGDAKPLYSPRRLAGFAARTSIARAYQAADPFRTYWLRRRDSNPRPGG